MRPNDLNLFSSRLEMVDAAQSRLAAALVLHNVVESLPLAAPAATLELPVVLLLPMVTRELLAAEIMGRWKQRKKMNNMGVIKG
jgi:hypothetical protein